MAVLSTVEAPVEELPTLPRVVCVECCVRVAAAAFSGEAAQALHIAHVTGAGSALVPAQLVYR
jgi:O-acetylhomoserine/O-acetylserine sulfhydrylase-like pyridoxal-dependent enzyme